MFSCPIPNYTCEPILAVKHRRPVLFCEALFRGQKPAEETWVEVDRNLFEHLANTPAPDKWKRKTLAVNLSTDSVLGITDDVVKAASSNWNLCLEWTEDFASNGDLHRAAERLVEWRKEQGLLISVDDVGAGMDGMLRTTLTQPDVLKIDGNFLKLAMASAENREILQHMISHFSMKKMTVVAEHIETRRDLSFARAIGCTAWQGFWSREPGFGYT
ncbi:MAG: EAL domain-containing protein [Methylobacter sp.]|nr:EAL domain-containing protein [Methylobacter sp.]